MISIRDLVKVYVGPVTALQGLSLDVPKGMFGLLGPNGSGKSTLMRILAGLLEPTAGALLWDEVDVVGKPELVWPRLGYLPQEFGFYPNLSGEEMLLHMLRLKGVRAPGGLTNLCAELLERVNLTAAAKRRTKAYSGGMKQRLGIAQAIAGNPDLIIVDEPTAGLDPEERVRFYRLLSQMSEDRTVLLSTHIVQDVATLCPRFAVIRHGRLVTQTSPARAKSALKGKVFEGLLDDGVSDSLPPGSHVTSEHLVEGRSAVRVYVPAGIAPPGFRPAQPNLDDAYLLWMRAADATAPSEVGAA